jgi:hypothetical protein
LLSSQGEVLGEDELVLFGEGAVGDLGSPQACLLPDGRVAVVYYANNKKDAADDSAPRYIETAIVEILKNTVSIRYSRTQHPYHWVARYSRGSVSACGGCTFINQCRLQ